MSTERTPETLREIEFFIPHNLALAHHIARHIMEHATQWAQERSDAAALREQTIALNAKLQHANGLEGTQIAKVILAEERIRLLERAGGNTLFVLTTDVPNFEVDAVIETWEKLLPASPAVAGKDESEFAGPAW